ncbi:MAG TPA: methionine adenosyltransferase [Candidatus Binataceae bacterium]|nr:methionine adenosyltransferase [Candidatus Binataceae bacterium]
MPDDVSFVITSMPPYERSRAQLEICEHKGIGHPDSICDGAAEAVSRALSQAYLRAAGEVLHHNVDKALLVGGQSRPRFGGGEVNTPVRLIIGGRATPVAGLDLEQLVRGAAREYLVAALHCDPGLFVVEPATRTGSPNLVRIFARGPSARIANDTSFGAGYAPLSHLERAVLKLAEILRSPSFRAAFPAAGDDFKLMGVRTGRNVRFTVALAFIDRTIRSASEYFATKSKARRYLTDAIDIDCEIDINMLDDPQATDETGLYLTVTGLSAENGDDGEVGRGNRVNGLITPYRRMSLEAAAGKNPVAHIGKLYNVLAAEIAAAICAEVEGVTEASVQILSTIGRPVAEPQLIAIELATAHGLSARFRGSAEGVARSCLGRIDRLSERLIRGELRVL